uniref:Uncharacterized protein LOC100375717 n=1 Tax=Saccoglossus kowalevskii TaxID=10224 RepID=A0ABM0M9D0_SACKO|nr:PREDICTED: uncharacterized protein LOC100375717 [Saccoglossus kowalevskii]
MWTTKRHVTLLVVVILFINCNGFSLDFTDIMDSAMSYIRTEERNAVNVDEIMARFKKSVDDLVDEHLNAFQEAYKIPQTRSKRELPEELDVINDAHYRLTNVTTSEVYNTTLYFGDNVISDVTDFQLDSYMHILMLLQDEDGYSSAVILRQNGSEWNVTEWLDAPAIKDVTSFTVGTDLFIVLVQDSYEDRGTGKVPLTQIRRYKQGATSIEDYSLQRMHTYGASSVTTFDLPHKDTKCMIITKGGLETRSDVYCSLGNYFDHITSVRTSWPNSIEAFTMHDNVHLAVPHMDSLENNPETDSEILVLNLHTESFDHVQYIRTLRAMQFEHISYGTGTFVEHFLILRNQIHADDSDDIPDASIYKYVKGKFVPFQCIHIKNGQIEYLNLIEGDDQKNVLILITNLDVNPIQLYEYDGWRFVPTTVNFEHNNPGIKRAFPGYSFVRGVIFVLLVDYEEHENYVETLHFSSIRPIFDARESAKEACANAELIISTELERFNDIEAAACDLVYTDSRVVITGEKTFVDEITVTNVSHIYQIEGNNGAFFDKSEVSALPEVKENITNIQQRLEVVEGLLNRAMKTVGDQNILGHKTFMNLTTESLNVKSNFILDDMEDVDGVNFTELELDTMKINVDQDLYNRFSFHGGIVFEDGLFVDGNVDGQDPDTVVTLDGTQVIVVEQTFQDQILVEGHAEVFGTVDGIYLNSTSMLLTSGRGDVQVVTGNLTFPDVQFNNIESYGEVDGVKLDELRDNSVHTDGDYNITAVHRFHKMVNINSSLTVTKNHTLDDVDVEVLFNEILKKTVYQQIPANYTFTNLNITNNLDVHGTINGIDIPDDVLQVSQSATLNGNVTFTKDAIISTLDSRSSIDGIASNLEGGNNLDLLKTTGIQTVQFSRTFMDNIVAGNDLNIANKLTVDGVDISMMDSDAVKLNGNQDITGEKVFGSNITIESSLEVYGRINGIDVYDLTKSCVRIHDEMIETSSTITFEGDAVFQGNLDTKGEHSVHGINLHDLVVQGVAETIGGKKTFISDVKSRDDIHVDGLINDLEWEEIDDDAWMLNNTGQLVTVSGSKTFTGDFTISNSFNVTGTIDGN